MSIDSPEMTDTIQPVAESSENTTSQDLKASQVRDFGLLKRISGIFRRNKGDSRRVMLDFANLEINEESQPDLDVAGVVNNRTAEGDQDAMADFVEDYHPKESISSETEIPSETEIWDLKNKLLDASKLFEEILQGGDYQQVFMDKAADDFDWIVEDPKRVVKTLDVIKQHELFLSRASLLPGLAETEQKSLKMAQQVTVKMKEELIKRGVEIQDRQAFQSEGQDVGEEATSIPNDIYTEYEYAYHTSPTENIYSIALSGLQLSGSNSKEPGTIYYANSGNAYLVSLWSGVVYRTHITNIPELKECWSAGVDGKPHFAYAVGTSRTPIPSDRLEYSLDKGETWRKDMSIFRETH